MKKTALTVTVVLVMGFALALAGQQTPAKGGSSHLGTWQLVSTKYGDEKEFSNYSAERRRVKLITATHFTWVDYNGDTKEISSAAGGPYSLEGNVYTETIEFVGEGMESYLGKKQAFTIKIDGDKLSQSGHLSDGLKIEEVWRRIK